MDDSLTHFINQWAGASPLIDAIMRSASFFGVYTMLICVIALWWLGRPRLNTRQSCIAIALTFVGGLLLNQAILLFIHRPRPYNSGITHVLIEPSTDWSFPSDHATAAMTIVLGLWAFGPRWLAAPMAVIAALVALSRVYLGIHYVGDILGGMVTAVVAVCIVSRFYNLDNLIARRLVTLL
jgi:undecaprenyl-diphosphatase